MLWHFRYDLQLFHMNSIIPSIWPTVTVQKAVVKSLTKPTSADYDANVTKTAFKTATALR